MPICVDKLCKRPARASVQVGASQATSCLAHGSSLDLRSILSPSQREPSPTLNLRTSPYVKLRRQGSVIPRLLRLRDPWNMKGRNLPETQVAHFAFVQTLRLNRLSEKLAYGQLACFARLAHLRLAAEIKACKRRCVSRSNKPPSVFAAFGLALYPDYWIR